MDLRTAEDRSYHRWWKRKQAAEKRRREIWEAQQKLDEEIEQWTQYKEKAEDFCHERFELNSEGEWFIQLREKENMFHVLNHIHDIEQCMDLLKRHIPNLEYDPRIVWDCPYEYSNSKT
ncbi:MAG: hypothetical protein ABJN35_11130 [Erythrobacter sp.]